MWTPFWTLGSLMHSIDNVKLIQQACQLKWGPVVLYMSLLVHMSPRVLRIVDLWGEWISPSNSIIQGCGSSNSWARALLYKLLQEPAFPVSLFRLDSRSTTSTTTAKVRSFRHFTGPVEATCMLDRGLTSLGFDALPEQVGCGCLTLRNCCVPFGASWWSKRMSFEGADSVRDVGLDANAGHKRSVKIQTKREQKCRIRDAHIKVIQNGSETQAPDYEVIQKNWDPASRGQRARWRWSICPSSIQRQENDDCRCIWQEKQDRMHHNNPTLFILERVGDPAIWFPLDQLRTWLELQGEENGAQTGKD